jgi:type IV pilus assembly protein PilM
MEVTVRWTSPNAGPIAVDVGWRSIRVVQLRKGTGRSREADMSVVAAASAELDADQATDIDALRRHLSSLLSNRRFSGRDVVTCVPSGAVELKNIRLPVMPDAELESAVAFEVGDRFGGGAGKVTMRYLRAGMVGGAEGKQQEVIVLGARQDAIDARLDLLMRLGLRVVGMEPAFNAFFRPFERYLRRASDVEQSNAYVDIGGLGSRIIVTRGSEILFVKACPVGGAMLDERVAKGLSIDQVAAAELLRRCLYGEGVSEEDQQKVHEAIRPALEQLGKEIGLCLRYCAVTFRGDRPDQIVCGGRDAGAEAVRTVLAEVTRMPVEAADAFRGIDCGPAFGGDAPQPWAWNIAVGMALRRRRPAAVEASAA